MALGLAASKGMILGRAGPLARSGAFGWVKRVHHPTRPLSSSAEAVGRLGGSSCATRESASSFDGGAFSARRLSSRPTAPATTSTGSRPPSANGGAGHWQDLSSHLLIFAISTVGEALSEKSVRLPVPFLEAPEQKRENHRVAAHCAPAPLSFIAARWNLEASRRHNCAKNPSEARSMTTWSRRNASAIGAALLVSLVVIGPACSNSAKSRAETPKARGTFLAVEDLPRRPPPMTPEERAKILQELTALRDRQKAVAPNSN